MTYEEDVIKAHMGPRSTPRDPLNGLTLDKAILIPLVQLQNSLDDYYQKHPELFDITDMDENPIYLPIQFWLAFYQAITEDSIENFQKQIKLDPRLLKITSRQSINESFTVEFKEANNEPVFHLVLKHHAVKIINYLFELKELPNKIKDFTQLFSTIENIKALFLFGINVDWQDTQGQTLLHYAAMAAVKEVMEFLLANKAVLEARDVKGKTPLLSLAEEGNTDEHYFAMLCLMRAGKQQENSNNILKARDNNGNTALHLAKTRQIALLIISHCKEELLDTPNSANQAPIYTANAEVTAVLIACGAKLTEFTGPSPLFDAIAKKMQEKALLLIAADGFTVKEKEQLLTLAWRHNAADVVIKALLEKECVHVEDTGVHVEDIAMFKRVEAVNRTLSNPRSLIINDYKPVLPVATVTASSTSSRGTEVNRLFIRNCQDGSTYILAVHARLTIWAVKQQLHQQHSATPSADAQRLISAGQHLEDVGTLADYNIQNESTLFLVGRSRGD
jgi:hypothetical protein